MPSEKFRYFERNRGPTRPLDDEALLEHLPSLGPKHLARLLWVRAQNDDVLMKALTASVAIRLAGNDWDKVRNAIDYALHFPNFVRYTEGGHGLVLDEIKAVLETLIEQGQRSHALRAAQYAIERAQVVAENFENDWDWTSSLEELSEWVESANRSQQ